MATQRRRTDGRRRRKFDAPTRGPLFLSPPKWRCPLGWPTIESVHRRAYRLRSHPHGGGTSEPATGMGDAWGPNIPLRPGGRFDAEAMEAPMRTSSQLLSIIAAIAVVAAPASVRAGRLLSSDEVRGVELNREVGHASVRQEVKALERWLVSQGYERLRGKEFAALHRFESGPGKSVGIPYFNPVTQTKALIHIEKSAGHDYWGLMILRNEGGQPAGESYFLDPISGSVSPDGFFRNWVACTAGGCLASAIGCLDTLPGGPGAYGGCTGLWCGGMALGCAVTGLIAGW